MNKFNQWHKAVIILFFSCTFFLACKKTDSFQPIQRAESSTLSNVLANKPNIILILGDDVGYEIPTVNGGQSYNTPNLDNVASAGMQFTRCHSSPLCSPSRFMLLTGKYNFRNYNEWGIMDTSNRTIANMLKDAGYKTCVAGKWQLDGGDVALHSLGFEDYMVWSPFTAEAGESVQGHGSRYKDPVIYKDSVFIKGRATRGKYGDDIFTNYIKDFIDSNKTKPFFVYYPICLVHYPFCPPPNHPDFVTWDAKTSIPDKKYYPSMVNYMDTKIGEIINKVNSAGIADNTLVIFVGDNGTDVRITSKFNNKDFTGGKGKPTEAGTHVPLLMWWQGNIISGSRSGALIDFTDFMPTLAEVAKIPLPASYGVLDGTSFFPAMKGNISSPRQSIYCYYQTHLPNRPPNPLQEWAQDTAYKLYSNSGLFYHYAKDLDEVKPIADSALTQKQKKIKQNLQSVLANMRK